MADPYVTPILPVLYQYFRAFPFIYFFFMVMLHDLSLKIPLHNDFRRSALPKVLKSNNPHPPQLLAYISFPFLTNDICSDLIYHPI